MSVPAILVLLAALIAGCASQEAAAPPTANLTGTWQGTMTSVEYVETETVRFQLEQSEASVSGSFQALVGYRYYTLGTLSGIVSANRVNLTLTLDPEVTSRGGGLFAGTVTQGNLTGTGTLRNDETGEQASMTFSATKL